VRAIARVTALAAWGIATGAIAGAGIGACSELRLDLRSASKMRVNGSPF